MFFYLFLLIFIPVEIYYVYNKFRLDQKFSNKDLDSLRKLDIVYYVLRVLYWVSIFSGIFINPLLFSIMLGINIIKFPIYSINRKLYIIYDNILPILSILLILIIIAFKLL